VVNRIGNLILVITLVTVPASVQYPLVTAGTIAVCTAISFFMGQKPRRGECVAVGLAVFGILVQILLPIVGRAMALPEGVLAIL
jgi:multidrug transporter EmrE-like cation transporter